MALLLLINPLPVPCCVHPHPYFFDDGTTASFFPGATVQQRTMMLAVAMMALSATTAKDVCKQSNEVDKDFNVIALDSLSALAQVSSDRPVHTSEHSAPQFTAP